MYMNIKELEVKNDLGEMLSFEHDTISVSGTHSAMAAYTRPAQQDEASQHSSMGCGSQVPISS